MDLERATACSGPGVINKQLNQGGWVRTAEGSTLDRIRVPTLTTHNRSQQFTIFLNRDFDIRIIHIHIFIILYKIVEKYIGD